MSYSDLYTSSQSRYSKLLAGFAVLAVLSGAAFYFFQNTPLTRASKQVIKQHEIVNVSPQQIGIFWEVAEADEGWIIYGESDRSLNQVALDERDIKFGKEKRLFHYALLKNVKPETTYYYKVISNNETITAENNTAFQVKSVSSSLGGSSLSPAYGTVLSDGGSPVNQAFIKITVGNAYPVLGMTGETGEWLIPMQYLIEKQKTERIPADENTVATIQIFNDSDISQIKATIQNTHPLPQSIILGKNYSFLNKVNVLSAQTQKKSEHTTVQQNTTEEISLLYPKENAVIPASKPLIKGKALAGNTVSISINSNPVIQQNVRVDVQGEWNLSLVRNLAPGAYIITMKTLNDRGREVTVERRFTILKSGERVLGESTPAGTITLSPSPSTTTPSPTLIVENVPTPTDILEYDMTPTPTPPPPVSGVSMITYMIGGIGLLLLGAGLVLIL